MNDWFTHACDSQGRCGTANPDLIRIVGPRGSQSSVPGFDTRIARQLSSPYVQEMTVGYGASWFTNFVTRVDLVARDWKNFYAFRVDQTTPHQLDPLGLNHLDYLNVFHRTAFVTPNTVVNTAATSANFAPFDPYSGIAPIECPQGASGATCKAMGANFQKGANFGKVVSSGAVNYQQPRSWSVNAGLRF